MAQRNNGLCDLGVLCGEALVGPKSRRSWGVSLNAAPLDTPGKECQKQILFGCPQPAQTKTCQRTIVLAC